MHEFVSDTMQASSEDLVEVQEGMKKLVLGSKSKGKIGPLGLLKFLFHRNYILSSFRECYAINKTCFTKYDIVVPMKWKFAHFYVFGVEY